MTPDDFARMRRGECGPGTPATRRHVPDQLESPLAFVGRVTAVTTVPTTTGVFFAVHPVSVSGPEGEGSPGALSVDTSTIIPVYVIGPRAPVAGDDLVCRFVNHRWIAERLKSHTTGSISIPGCPCTSTPSVLSMSVSKPQLNFGILQPATLVYGPTPPQLSNLGLGSSSYLSTSSFVDTFTGDQFQYYLGCISGYYLLTRVYAKSVYGNPYRDIVRYKWLIGLPGNTCTPFLLSQGQIFAGGDPTCIVTVTQ